MTGERVKSCEVSRQTTSPQDGKIRWACRISRSRLVVRADFLHVGSNTCTRVKNDKPRDGTATGQAQMMLLAMAGWNQADFANKLWTGFPWPSRVT